MLSPGRYTIIHRPIADLFASVTSLDILRGNPRANRESRGRKDLSFGVIRYQSFDAGARLVNGGESSFIYTGKSSRAPGRWANRGTAKKKREKKITRPPTLPLVAAPIYIYIRLSRCAADTILHFNVAFRYRAMQKWRAILTGNREISRWDYGTRIMELRNCSS